MKKLTEHYKEKLLDQAIQLYYDSCKKVDMPPIDVRRNLCNVGSKFVFLRNAIGAEVWIRHTSTYLFCQVTCQEFSEKIIESPIK